MNKFNLCDGEDEEGYEECMKSLMDEGLSHTRDLPNLWEAHDPYGSEK